MSARAGAPAQRAGAAPVVVAVLVMVVWGATPIATRLALRDIAPLLVATLRVIIAGAVAAPLLARMGQGLPRSTAARRLLAVSSVSGFVVFPILFTLGQERTSALHGVMILALLPIITGLYAALAARRRPHRLWLAGCAVALVGEVILIAGRSASTGEVTMLGDLLVLASALTVCAGYVAGAMLPPRGLSSSATTFWGVALAAVVVAPVALGQVGVGGLPRAGVVEWGAIVFLALVTSVIGYIGWYWALDRGGISRIATLQFLQPVSGLVLAVIVLGDHFTVQVGIGAAAIVGGVMIAQRS